MTDYAKLIYDLRVRFLERLRKQHEELLEYASATGDQSQRAKNRKRIQKIAHQIAGLAKSVGFEELGTAAFSLDLAFTESDEAGLLQVRDNEISKRLNTLIDECARTLRQ